jgi:uncharacterized membrane protein YphA (DoxX/SURF4 family)
MKLAKSRNDLKVEVIAHTIDFTLEVTTFVGETMNVILWIIAGLLAAAFLAAGTMKLTQPKEKLAASGMAWTEDFSFGALKAIGALEVLAAIGLILPAALGIVPMLVPLAGLGLALLMVGAIITHARRKESQAIVLNLVLLALAVFVVWGRFGPESFTA